MAGVFINRPAGDLCMHVAAVFITGLDLVKPTVKHHFAALRMLFDWLVFGPDRREPSTRRARPERSKHVFKK